MDDQKSIYKDYNYKERRVGASVEFHVDNLPKSPTKLALVVANHAIQKLTVLLLALATTALWLDIHRPQSHGIFLVQGLLLWLRNMSPTWLLLWLQKTPTIALVAGWLVAVLALLKRPYKTESLFVIHGLGLQVYSSGSYYFFSSTTFLNKESIVDLVIHEGFRGMEVVFFMAVLVKNKDGMVVVFPDLLPRRKMLERVWRESRKCLYSDEPERFRKPELNL